MSEKFQRDLDEQLKKHWEDTKEERIRTHTSNLFMAKKEKSEECMCKDVFSVEERAQLGDILVRNVSEYYNEIKDVFKDPLNPTQKEIGANEDLIQDFIKWRNITNLILKKCDLEEWNIS
ncbi:hypothetical protein LCGC14_1471170 [marine sediment metagenome]|uniref:Uncharacterized protein n=1 Tax=marine sediment metagenome TaxID=412755 RepID=A0A0F9ME33_9ZZZZ